MNSEFCISSVLWVLVVLLTLFLSNRSQHVMVDGCRSTLVNVESGVPQGSISGPLLFLLYTSDPLSILGKSRSVVTMLHFDSCCAIPGVRVRLAESLSRDLVKVSDWRDIWEMKLNASKTKTMIVSRSGTLHPQSPVLTIGGTMLKESDDPVIL